MFHSMTETVFLQMTRCQRFSFVMRKAISEAFIYGSVVQVHARNLQSLLSTANANEYLVPKSRQSENRNLAVSKPEYNVPFLFY